MITGIWNMRISTPFFWLADNAGYGASGSTADQWKYYAQVRAQEKFSAAQWIAAPGNDREGHSAFTGTNHIQINLGFFKDVKLRR